MAEKNPSADLPKSIDPSIVVYSTSPPSRRILGIRVHNFWIRFCQALLAIVIAYSLRSWLYSRFRSQVHGIDAAYSWPIKAFNHHGDLKLNAHHAEHHFLQVPDEQSAIAASRDYAGLPHLAGSNQDLATAKYIVRHFQENFNIDTSSPEDIYSAGSAESRGATLNIPKTKEPRAWIDTYYPLLNTPLDRTLQILDNNGSVVWTAQLEEDGDPADEDAANARTAVPAFHGLSKGGDVTGEVIYANYGRVRDFDELEWSGVNITGKIALIRYGGIFRGLKVKHAEERGAIGVLIYSDPRDDGSVTVGQGYKAYPHGPARNPTAVQRGSVQFLSFYPGDPTTPGAPAYENSTRVDGTNIPHIPSLPISWSNAQVLLAEIGENGQGRSVRLVNKVDNKVTPIWNAMGVIPGHMGSEVVVLGCHRDAWVLGAADPSSGTTSVHEVIRGLGALYRKGWRPLRTILLASWDAEEYGLVGSTEWGEDFTEWIEQHVVAYVNMDTSVSGSRFGAQASPSMTHLVRQAAQDIPHPTREGSSLWDARTDMGNLTGFADPEVLAMADAEELAAELRLGVTPLGSGSDYTVFLQRIGVASSNAGFGSTLTDAVYHYHSIYDSQRFQELYADPGFHRHVAISKFLGLITLRLADSFILPLNTTHYALELQSYLAEVEKIARGWNLGFHLFTLHRTMRKLYRASVQLDKEKHDAEEHLRHVLKRWQRHHHGHSDHGQHFCRPLWKRFHTWLMGPVGTTSHSPDVSHDHSLHDHPHLPRRLIEAVKRVQNVNKRLRCFERGFISSEGLVGREWYRHLGVAPGRQLGYGATTLPGLTEALTIDRNSTQAIHEAERLTELLKKLVESIAIEDDEVAVV